jgi:hypothetical protein
MSHDLDRSDPKTWAGTPEAVAEWQQAQKELHKTIGRRPKKEEFCQLPFHVIASITKVADRTGSVLGVLTALYEIWYRNNHYNPVRLTSAALRKYGVSAGQKRRALKPLERSGQIWVNRQSRRNPLVTLKWLPLKSEFHR